MQTDSFLSSPASGFVVGLNVPSDRVGGVTLADDVRSDANVSPAIRPTPAELVRETIATANSGGGELRLDIPLEEQELIAHVQRASGSDFDDLHVVRSDSAGHVMRVGAAMYPLHFDSIAIAAAAVGDDGNPVPSGFYFRRDGRTVLGGTADARNLVERVLHYAQRRWSRSVRRVIEAPVEKLLGPKRKRHTNVRKPRAAELKPVRIVKDPAAPALQPQDVERLYPWRQKELVQELNRRFGRRLLNSYDVQAVRRHHRLDEWPDFIFNLPGAGRRYSPAAADWIVEQYEKDPDFFRTARAADQETLKLRRRKPR